MSAPPYLTLPCEGSNLVGHSTWRGDLLGVGVMCQMCGQWFAPVQDTCVTHDGVPEHRLSIQLGAVVAASSVRSYLNINAEPGQTFERVGRGIYRLRK